MLTLMIPKKADQTVFPMFWAGFGVAVAAETCQWFPFSVEKHNSKAPPEFSTLLCFPPLDFFACVMFFRVVRSGSGARCALYHLTRFASSFILTRVGFVAWIRGQGCFFSPLLLAWEGEEESAGPAEL